MIDLRTHIQDKRLFTDDEFQAHTECASENVDLVSVVRRFKGRSAASDCLSGTEPKRPQGVGRN